MMYNDDIAHVPSDAILLNATLLSMLITVNRMEIPNDAMIEFSGISEPSWTRDSQPPKGSPWSLTSANSCLEPVATLLTHLTTAMMTIVIESSTVAPAVD
jgi:hypothetical protein